MLLQPTGHLLHVLLAERLGTRRIPRRDGCSDGRVVVVHLVDSLKRLGHRICARSERVAAGQPHQDFDKELQDWIFRLPRQRHMELVTRSRQPRLALFLRA